MANVIRIYVKKGASIAVKRRELPPIKTDARKKEYVELDEEGQAIYQLLSEGFNPGAKDRARIKLLDIWNGKKT